VKYYGKAIALRLVGVFWLVMSLSGLITEYIFKALGISPTMKMSVMSQSHIGMNRTTILNLIAVATLIWVFYMYQTRDRSALNVDFAKDYVCGMQVRISDAPASFVLNGQRYYFCMEGCKESFVASPAKYLPN
jgi:YHS domain-containing protein